MRVDVVIVDAEPLTRRLTERALDKVSGVNQIYVLGKSEEAIDFLYSPTDNKRMWYVTDLDGGWEKIAEKILEHDGSYKNMRVISSDGRVVRSAIEKGITAYHTDHKVILKTLPQELKNYLDKCQLA